MFTRYTLNDVQQNRFYQLPKFLFEGELKVSLSNDAKVLYSLLRDRHDLSLTNRWINSKGEVYIIFSREEMANALGCSPPTLRKIINQLVDRQLMEEERQGLNKPNLIYLNYINISPDQDSNCDDPPVDPQEKAPKTQETSGVKEIYSPECKNLTLKTERNLHSRTKETYSQECKEFTPNDTEYNKTNISDTEVNETNHSETDLFEYQSNLSHLAPVTVNLQDSDAIDTMGSTYQDTISYLSEQIEADVLSQKYEKRQIEGIIHILADIMTSQSGYVTIGGAKKPIEVVKGQFAKLTSDNIEYVLSCLAEQTNKIKNIKAYLITSLYNASDTQDLYWSNVFSVNNHE